MPHSHLSLKSTGSVMSKKPLPWYKQMLVMLGLENSKDEHQDLILYLRRVSKTSNVLNRNALAIVEGAIKSANMQASEIMIARSQIKAININSSRQEILQTVVESGHSRFPVFDQENKEVLGLLLAKDLISLMLNKDDDIINVEDILRPATKIPENKYLLVLLNEFREQRNHMAIVYDEYGDIAGLVTIEDVLEEIVGNIEDEYDKEVINNIRQANDNTYTINANTSIEEFNTYFNTHLDDTEFDTIGGIILQNCKRIPKRDDTVKAHGLTFQIIKADKKTLHTLRLIQAAAQNN